MKMLVTASVLETKRTASAIKTKDIPTKKTMETRNVSNSCLS